MGQNSGFKQVLSAFKRKPKGTPVGSHPDPPPASPLTKRLFAFSPAKAASKISYAAAAEHEEKRQELIQAVAPAAAAAAPDDAGGGDAITVVVRVRPRNGREASLGGAICVTPAGPSQVRLGGTAEAHTFAFDHVAGEGASQAELFEMAGRPVVNSCLHGFNSCLLAYGQTGSGKTYSMLGDTSGDAGCALDDPRRGLTQRVFEHLFAEAQSGVGVLSVRCSFLELYNEQISDLLSPTPGAAGLPVREDSKRVYVEGLSEEAVTSVEDVVALLVRGTANRRVGETQMNDRSSRSHCVFTAAVERRVPGGAPGAAPTLLRSRLHLVDLAGSERQKTSGAAGERLREASSINKSLSALGLVIMNLVKAQRAPATHVPYRDSKLTHLLQDSLGGNARTVMVAAVSPVAVNAAETLSTLRFADSAKRIKNRAVVNEEAEGDAEALRKEVARLKSELAAARQGSGVIHGGGGTPVKSLVPALGAADGPPPSTRMTQAGGPAGEGTRRALMGALRREEAAAAAAAATAEELQQLRGLVAAKDSDLQRSHMMLKLKDGRLARLAAGGEGSDERAAALQAEVDVLRARVDNHPDLKRFALENLRLAQEAARLGGAAAAGELDALLGDVVALRRELLGLAAAAEEAQDGAAAARADADAAQERWRRGEARLAEVQAQLRCREEAGPEARARAEALAAENEELRLQLVAAAGLRQELDQMTAHAAGLESEVEAVSATEARLTAEAAERDAVQRSTLAELERAQEQATTLESALQAATAAAEASSSEVAAQRAQHEAAQAAAAGRIAGAIKAAQAVQQALEGRTAQVKELQAALEMASEERDGLVEEAVEVEGKLEAAEARAGGLEADVAAQAQRAEAAERAAAAAQEALNKASSKVGELTGGLEAAAAAMSAKEAELEAKQSELAAEKVGAAAVQAELSTAQAAGQKSAVALAAAQAASAAVSEAAAAVRASLAAAQRRCADLEEQAQAAEDAKDDLQYDLSDKSASLAEANELAASLRASLASAKADAARCSDQVSELTASVAAARQAGGVAERERAALQARVTQLEAAVDDARVQVEAARGGPLEKERELLLAKAELTDVRAKLAAANESADGLQAAVRRRDEAVSALRSEMAAEVSDAAQQVQQLLAATARAEGAESRAAALERLLTERASAAQV